MIDPELHSGICLFRILILSMKHYALSFETGCSAASLQPGPAVYVTSNQDANQTWASVAWQYSVMAALMMIFRGHSSTFCDLIWVRKGTKHIWDKEKLERHEDFRVKLVSNFYLFQATKALSIIFSNKVCTIPMGDFYVSVLIFLVIQLHYLVSLPEVVWGWEDRLQTSSFVR